MVSQAGAVLLLDTVCKTGLDQAVSAALTPWRKPRTVHDPGKIPLDLALAVALGGDCLADVAMLRCELALFGPVASDPTVSRLIDTLAGSGERALQAIRSARAEVRNRVWLLAGTKAPDAARQVTVDLDGVLVIAHSDKQDAAATWKKAYGHHPLTAFVDHGPGGTGEPVAALLRPGNAGSDTAADHITTTQLALAQLPKKYRRGRRTLIRTDSAGGTHDFVAWLAKRGRWLSCSVGMVITEPIHRHVLKIPGPAWTPAAEADGQIRDGAWVAELTGKLLDGWPSGIRLIVRKERPHPGAQLRITDADGMRIQASLPTPPAGRSPSSSSVTGCGPGRRTGSGPPRPPGEARLWEPRRLRLRLFAAAGQLVTTGRPAHPSPRPTLALAQSHHCRPRPARPTSEPRLTSRPTTPPTAPPDPEQWNPAPTRGDTRAAALPTLSPARENGPPTPSADRHETSRLGADGKAAWSGAGRSGRGAPGPQRPHGAACEAAGPSKVAPFRFRRVCPVKRYRRRTAIR